MRKILYIMLALTPLYANAGGWQPTTKVLEYLVEQEADGSRFYVRFASNYNPDQCTSNQKEWIRVDGATAKGKYIIPIIMSAKATNNNVSPHIQGCDDWNRPKLEGIAVNQ